MNVIAITDASDGIGAAVACQLASAGKASTALVLAARDAR